MPSLKLTSKRQATFPQETCEALRVGPGDVIELEARVIEGERVWLLRPKSPSRPWLGMLRGKAKPVADHSLEAIRESIRQGRSTVGP